MDIAVGWMDRLLLLLLLVRVSPKQANYQSRRREKQSKEIDKLIKTFFTRQTAFTFLLLLCRLLNDLRGSSSKGLRREQDTKRVKLNFNN